MDDDDLDVLEERLAEALVAYQEGRESRPGSPGHPAPVPTELRGRYEGTREVLQLLERAWPRDGTTDRLDWPLSESPDLPGADQEQADRRAGAPGDGPATTDGAGAAIVAQCGVEGPQPDPIAPPGPRPEAPAWEMIEGLLADQHRRWRSGDPLAAERYLEDFPGIAAVPGARLALVAGEFLAQEECGLGPSASAFAERFPDLRADLEAFRAGIVPGGAADRGRPAGGGRPVVPGQPEFIGRYRVERVLGQGGFGKVFLARDDELGRPVAIKVPRPHRVSGPRDLEAYLDEARILAGLDHANIVPVYDVGHTDDGLCFVVSKVIEGTSLSVAAARPPRSGHAAIAGLIAGVADALHYAHGQGLVHRDVKPGNILIDGAGRPFLADFGLALREEDSGRGPGHAGTPSYMSPEQALGEGHRVDRRSDIFSLGIVLYELLTGRHPFGPGCPEVLMERIATAEARPPRQVDAAIPEELDLICQLALARRVPDRYDTAKDFADDLRRFIAGSTPEGSASAGGLGPLMAGARPLDSTPSEPIPKGLRSFDAGDAGFFLGLLHGPRDRQGVPEAIRFWKSRIEAVDPEEAFPVGLLYGPSGCGKSSIVKAGLLPRLAPRVVPVYLEAVGEMEEGLLRRLRAACPGLAPGLGLVEALAAIRRGGLPGQGSKVLLVLDQFEQWLHANQDRQGTRLVQALRQCDGRRLQALVIVRDDFWMASSRFMRELEVRVVEGHNAAAVDLFSPAHARKVLAAFGRAYGALDGPEDGLGPDHRAFLALAVRELAEGDKVSPIRLALFAELVKGRDWVPATVEELGGAVGIGVTFLEETFSAATAPPEHRLHEPAVRAVLGAVLPGPGGDLKGRARSGAELRAAAGYAPGSEDFEALMRILDRETRLLTPIAVEGVGPSSNAAPPEPSYQLTHDYLVPSVREWLARKQRETRRGRAGLKLAERAAFWAAKPERRQLPALSEWVEICALTSPTAWTGPQRAMMRAAARSHLARAGAALAVVAAGGLAALSVRSRMAEDINADRARALVQRLLDAHIAQVPAIVGEFRGLHPWADPLLRATLSDPDDDRRLHARLALLRADPGQAGPLAESLLATDPDTFAVLREALRPRRAELIGRLWDELASEDRDPDRRFRAAAALAGYDPEGERWGEQARFVAGRLIAQPSLIAPRWVDALRPVRHRLVPPLVALARDRSGGRDADHHLTMEILADYASDRPGLLADLLGDADPRDCDLLLERLRPHPEAAEALEAVLDGGPPGRAGDSPDALAGRRANALIALLQMGRPERLWPLLKADPDPRLRCLLIDRLAPSGVAPATLEDRLRHEPDDSACAALLLSLGGYGEATLPASRREDLEESLFEIYRSHPDAEVHAASARLLRSWGYRERVGAIDRKLAGRTSEVRRWYVNQLGQTMVIVPGPIRYRMGSPPEEPWRKGNEGQHWDRIPGPYDLSATEVTLGQFKQFMQENPDLFNQTRYDIQSRAGSDAPVVFIQWYLAARFCNWLSGRDGIPSDQWCYEPNDRGKYEEGMKIARDYRKRIGYRLPTEVEWEYACRAGTTTVRCFGATDELLPRYACFSANSNDRPCPVGTFRPNAFGLFDMHGNAFEWCQDEYGNDGVQEDDFRAVVEDKTQRVTRGGTYFNHPRQIRSAARNCDPPSFRDYAGGFRVARSRPAAPDTGPREGDGPPRSPDRAVALGR